MTRPLTEIDWEKVDYFLERGSPGTEIAGYLGIHYETLYRRCEQEHNVGFTEYSQLKRARGDALLRSKQYDVAMEGDKTMLVWLGKCRLGQQEINNHAAEKEKSQHAFVEGFHNHIMEHEQVTKSKTN